MTERKNNGKMRVLTQKGGETLIENKESVKKYQSKMDEFKIRPSAEEGQRIRSYAFETGRSIQGLFLEALREYMQNHPAE